MSATRDRNGAIVQVGSRVKVLHVRPSVLHRLNPDEARDVQSMEGETLEVYEVDEWGSAWVTKWWKPSDDKAFSHSLALAPEEMELEP